MIIFEVLIMSVLSFIFYQLSSIHIIFVQQKKRLLK